MWLFLAAENSTQDNRPTMAWLGIVVEGGGKRGWEE